MEVKLPIEIYTKFKPNYFGHNPRYIGFYKIDGKTQTLILKSIPKILDELNARQSKIVITLPIKKK